MGNESISSVGKNELKLVRFEVIFEDEIHLLSDQRRRLEDGIYRSRYHVVNQVMDQGAQDFPMRVQSRV